MARFEPEEHRRPSLPKPDAEDAADDDLRIFQVTERVTNTAQEFASGRFVRDATPRRLRFLTRMFVVDEQTVDRMRTVDRLGRPIAAVLAVPLLVALLVQVFSGTLFFNPKSGSDLLEKTKVPKDDVAWSIESIRVKSIDGSRLRQDRLFGFHSSPKARKLRGQIHGAEAHSYRIAVDGDTFVAQYDGQPTQLVGRKVTSDDLRPVSANDLEPHAGRMISGKATVDGERGWIVEFKLTPEILTRLLSVKLLNLADDDVAAITKGDFTTSRSLASVKRKGRTLHQIDTQITVNNAELRILATYREQDTGRLDDLDLTPNETEQVN